ncbi:MAG TPA: patatin-like phospholipase family protein [Steroidobacteraceae bacterium]|nr:patatin-like phospholipase family protein [Steroidobacteraceae bacterium]
MKLKTKWLIASILSAVVIVALGTYVKQSLKPVARLAAVPEDRLLAAQIPGIPNARYYVASDLDPLVREVVAARERERIWLAEAGHEGELPPAALLAISGGGDNGAFGAGLLNGWTAAGTRPVFKAVTGVSTGALIAPFAFLGKEYDPVLQEVYTRISPEDVARERGVLAAITQDGMADNRPLWTLISKYVNQKLLEAVAAEHARGRLLLIGTTNLDARQPVVWNMGVIAASGAPGALDLFRSILLASAAIPGAFPPSMIRVEVDGKPYDEMHVDGGASAQVFMYPPGLKSAATAIGETMQRRASVYVIRNSALAASWQPVERRTIGIAGRAIDSLIYTQGFGDLFRIYLTTQRDGLDFNLAYIGPEFIYKGKKKQFETAYMKALYEYGYSQGRAGYSWRKLPPGLDVPYGQ